MQTLILLNSIILFYLLLQRVKDFSLYQVTLERHYKTGRIKGIAVWKWCYPRKGYRRNYGYNAAEAILWIGPRNKE